MLSLQKKQQQYNTQSDHAQYILPWNKWECWFLWHQYCTICLILWSLHSLWLDYCIMIINDVSSWSRSISTAELRWKALSVSFLLTSQSRLIYKISIFTDLYTHTLLAWRRAPSCFHTSGRIVRVCVPTSLSLMWLASHSTFTDLDQCMIPWFSGVAAELCSCSWHHGL